MPQALFREPNFDRFSDLENRLKFTQNLSFTFSGRECVFKESHVSGMIGDAQRGSQLLVGCEVASYFFVIFRLILDQAKAMKGTFSQRRRM